MTAGRIAAMLAAAALVMVGSVAGAAPPVWTIEPTPAPVAANGIPAAVACPAVNTCIAVGRYAVDPFRYAAYAQAWDGASWRSTHLPLPADTRWAELTSIACTSVTHCIAVGDVQTQGQPRALAEVWDGTGWQLLSTPVLGTHTYNEFSGVSCWAADGCVAVGSRSPGSASSSTTLVERWDGTSWTVQPSADVPDAQYTDLFGVSCTSADVCLAVGSAQLPGASFRTFSERWDGAHWHRVSAPDPASSSRGALSAVVCRASDDCKAVGQYEAGPGLHPLAESWDGASWTIDDTPEPDGGGVLSDIACAGSRCVAVGAEMHVGGTVGHSETFALVFDGAQWTVSKPPTAGAANTGLHGVACATASDCLAVGSIGPHFGAAHAFATTWDGTSWTRQPVPERTAPAQSTLTSISCPDAVACAAVGWRVDSSGHRAPFAERRTGTGWRIVAVPGTRSPSTTLARVSCATPDDCVAVGSRGGAYGISPMSHSYAVRWDGRSWLATSAVDVAGRDALAGVSCASPADCVAVGVTDDRTAGVHPLAERWDGSHWSVLPMPVLGGAYLSAVSCPAVDLCFAVGHRLHAVDPGLQSLPLFAMWNGASWTFSEDDSTLGSLTSVSCSSRTFCMAIGAPASGRAALAERWNGTDWTPVAVPAPATGVADLVDVSCSSPQHCVAAGNEIRTGIWNGTSWAIRPATKPDTFSELSGVSCPTAKTCRIAGDAALAPLVEVGKFG